VISATNNPDLTKLTIPDILNNRVGALTYFIAPGDILQNTIRFIGPIDLITQVEGKLRDDIISYVFTAQTANTGTDELFDVEQVISDRSPAIFNFESGSQLLEAKATGGAYLPPDYVTASKNGEPVDLDFCEPALPVLIPLNIPDGDPATLLHCEATTDNGVTAVLDLLINVDDTLAPIIDPTSLPNPLPAEANVSGGAIVEFDNPTAGDVWGVDAAVDVTCEPASGSTFLLSAPNGKTTVSCTAIDDSGNESVPETFVVTVQDTQPPIIGDVIGYDPSPPPITLSEDESSFVLSWDFAVNDADASPTVECDPGTPVSAVPPLYKFSYEFPVGVTPVSCSATDNNGKTASLSFSVEIIDVTPPVISLIGDAEITLEMGSGPYEDPGATASDNGDPDAAVTIDVDSSAVDTTTAGTYTVSITATDQTGNSSTATRSVIVQDTQPPEIGSITEFDPPDTPYNLSASSSTFLLTWGPFTVSDADALPDVQCSPGTPDNSVSPPQYKFSHNFPVGTTNVVCTATDSSGLVSSVSFPVTIFDTIDPVIELNGEAEIILEMGSGPYNDPGATAIDNNDPTVPVTIVDNSGGVDTTKSGTYLVTYTATDPSGNSSTATRTVIVRDTMPPEIGPINRLDPPYNLTASSSTFPLTWGPFTVSDADAVLDVQCSPGTPDSNVSPPQYRFSNNFPVGTTTVICTATDSSGLVSSVSFPVTVFDTIAPVIELNGDAEITVEMGSGPYPDPGATAIDNNDPTVPVTIVDNSGTVDTTTPGTYLVTYTATDPSGNSSTATRTVIVKFVYGLTGIIPTKTNAIVGSSNPLYWAWLDADGNAADSSDDAQMLTITDCNTGEVLINPVGDPGASGFRFKADNWWQYNWDSGGEKGRKYCASVESGLTGQMQYSPEIRLR